MTQWKAKRIEAPLSYQRVIQNDDRLNFCHKHLELSSLEIWTTSTKVHHETTLKHRSLTYQRNVKEDFDNIHSTKSVRTTRSKGGGTSPMTTSLAKVTTEAIPSEQLDEAPVGNNNTQSSGSQHWHRRRSLPPRTTWLDNRSKTVRTVHGPRIHKMKRGLSVPATSHYSSPIDTQPDAHQLLNVDKPPTRVGYQTLTPSDQATGRHLSTTSASVPTYEGRKTLTFRGQRLGTILWSRVRELIAERLVTIPDNVTRVLLQEVYSAAWTQWPAHFKNFENSYLWQHKVQRRPNIVDTRVKVPLRPVVPTGPGTERTREFEMVLQSHVRTMALTAMIENKINERDESNIEDQPKAGVLRFAVVPTGFETSKRDEEEENEFIRGTDWKQDVQDQGREGRSTVAAVPT